ncbi:TRAP transporter substrate-binding protein [Acuticoccus kandeliae]|uniref:TRAP transporter substrate-binding protein n=1 Tax=Acuticoccus kandeliae TaxID=2073160 RepID=UPI000D3E4591|nr:TRAP transporter substrate-binding protein [Acuticoccus kandeliae]
MNRRVATLVLAGAATLAFTLGAHATDRIRWKVPNAFPSHLPAIGENAKIVADLLNGVSAGEIQFRIFEPGNLVPPLELTDAVQNGSIEAGYTWVGYDAGKIPSSPLFAARPFGMEPWEFTAWWYDGGGKALGEEVYGKRNVHPILCGINGPETAGWFNKEINTLADLQGLKIRFAGLGGQVLQKAGASVTLIPGGEIFQALEKGAIDASEFSMPAVDQTLGFDKVAKINYFPGWHQTYTAFHLIINKDVWNGLDDQTKAMMDTACAATTMLSLSRGEAIQGEVIRGFKERGVQATKVNEDLLHDLKKLSGEVLAEQAAADEDFKKVLDSQEAFMKGYKTWKDLAYLPRDFDDAEGQ